MQHRTTFFEKNVYYSGLKLINEIYNVHKALVNFHVFNKHVKTYLTDKAFYFYSMDEFMQCNHNELQDMLVT